MVKGIIGFLVLIAVVIGVFEVGPPMMANYSFEDDLKTIALVDGANVKKSNDDIRLEVLNKAREHQLPIQDTQITVQREDTPGVSAVYVAADYTVTINLPGYSFDMHFTPDSGNKTF